MSRFQAEMDTSIVKDSIASRKRKRDEEEMRELEETTFIVVSVVTMVNMFLRKNKHLVETTQTLLLHANIPSIECLVLTSCFLIN